MLPGYVQSAFRLDGHLPAPHPPNMDVWSSILALYIPLADITLNESQLNHRQLDSYIEQDDEDPTISMLEIP